MPADAVEIQQEGLRIPPVVLDAGVRAILLANSRTPVERAGDLDAQIGANVVGAARLADLLAEDAPVEEVIAYGERRMAPALAAVPDGTWTAADVLDSAGPAPAQQHPVRIAVTADQAGGHAHLRLHRQRPAAARQRQRRRGGDGQRRRLRRAQRASIPTIPANAGSLRPVRVVAPAGSVVAAEPPAAVAAGNVEVSQRVADVCLAALAQALPGRVGAAGQGTMNNVILGGRSFVYYETVAGGQGARPGRDGMSGVHTAMTNTLNTPIEALERAFPLRVRRLRLREGSGGAGRWRGGDGIERDVEVLEDVTLSLITERRRSAPWGLAGGGPGAAGRELAAAGRRRGRRRAAARQGHPAAAGGRRPAPAHPGRGRLRQSDQLMLPIGVVSGGRAQPCSTSASTSGVRPSSATMPSTVCRSGAATPRNHSSADGCEPAGNPS